MDGGTSSGRQMELNDSVEHNLIHTPRPAKVPRFKPKIKGKAKVEGLSSSIQVTSLSHVSPKANATVAAGVTELGVGNLMETDDGNDAVVREISVFCGSGYLGEDAQLYVMQYILRGAWRPYELSERCEEIRLTPIKSKIEVDLRMHVEDDSHNQDVLKPSKLQKQTLSSSVVSFSSPHAVGVLMQNQIHLNPVYAILQLHPSLSDLNDDIPKKELVPKPADANIKHMKDKMALKNSDQSAVNEEASVSLVYHASSSSASRKYKRSMTAEGQNQIEFGLKPSGYLHFLSSGGRGMADRKDSTLSMQLLLGLPLEERLKKWFCQVKQINRFVALKHLAYGYSEVDLLRVLHSYANLVQGLWVCKSSLLYDGDEAMQRDYILLLFSRRKTICYHQLKCIKLDHHLFKCMMNALAYERKTLGNWKFKESTDYSFIKCYPNIAKEQEKSWFDREKLILDFVRKLGKKIPQIARASLTSKRVKAKTAHKADSFTCMAKGTIDVSAGQTMTDETREHLPKALLEIFNDQKVRSLSSIVRGLREMALFKSSRPKEDPKTRLLVNAAENAVSAPLEDLLSIIHQVTVEIHGVHVLKHAGNPALDPLRNVVINLFQGKEPYAKLLKQEIKQAAQVSLKRDISDSEYTQVINELCVSSRGELELKSGE